MKTIKKWGIALAIFFVLLLVPLSAVLAFDFRAGDQIVTIGKDEVINDDVIVAGQAINVEGTINGDLIAAANTVTVSGEVKGSVIAGAGTVDISGKVGNDVLAGAGIVNITGEVGDNVIAGAGNLTISSGAKVKNEVLAGAGNFDLSGEVGSVNVSTGQAIISGKVAKNVHLKASEQVEVTSSADIGGDFNYKSPEKTEIPHGAKIGGETKWEIIKEAKRRARGLYGIPFALGFMGLVFSLFSKLGLLILGLIIVWLAPKPSKEVIDKITKTPGSSFGWGLLTVIVAPIVCFIALFTIIGIPLGLIGFALLGIAIYISKVFLGLFIGEKIIKAFSKNKQVSLYGAVALGTIIVIIVSYIPILGFLAIGIGSLFALGALLMVKKEHCLKICGREPKEVIPKVEETTK